ncbi:hypothetical protein [Methanoregula sp.]|uniref:hypothetical protein n=1 Tax=Methanoregula sp. TaxID=2052170 RepID=UPI003564CBAB
MLTGNDCHNNGTIVVWNGDTNMSVKISDTLRQYLGWCPQTQVQMRRFTVQPFEQVNSPGGDSGTPAMSLHGITSTGS